MEENNKFIVEFDKHTYRILKQRKKKFMQKEKYDDLSMADFIKIRCFCIK